MVIDPTLELGFLLEVKDTKYFNLGLKYNWSLDLIRNSRINQFNRMSLNLFIGYTIFFE